MKPLDVEVHDQIPNQFCPQVQISACYLEVDGKILLLQQSKKKSQPGKWGVPAGKLEKQETPEQAAKRELFEETGIDLGSDPTRLQFVATLYIRRPGFDFIYHSFKVQMHEGFFPEVQLSNEHQNYTWASSEDLEQLPLITGALEALKRYRKASFKKRLGSSVSAYLILQKGTQILLGLRKNTGYKDGEWSLVAGHVEDGEPATNAMVREAKEEIGIELSPTDLRVVHIMHRKSNRLNVDIFFVASSWKGLIKNCEPDKCEKLEFFEIGALPPNFVDYHDYVLKAIPAGEFYSEHGWG